MNMISRNKSAVVMMKWQTRLEDYSDMQKEAMNVKKGNNTKKEKHKIKNNNKKSLSSSDNSLFNNTRFIVIFTMAVAVALCALLWKGHDIHVRRALPQQRRDAVAALLALDEQKRPDAERGRGKGNKGKGGKEKHGGRRPPARKTGKVGDSEDPPAKNTKTLEKAKALKAAKAKAAKKAEHTASGKPIGGSVSSPRRKQKLVLGADGYPVIPPGEDDDFFQQALLHVRFSHPQYMNDAAKMIPLCLDKAQELRDMERAAGGGGGATRREGKAETTFATTTLAINEVAPSSSSSPSSSSHLVVDSDRDRLAARASKKAAKAVEARTAAEKAAFIRTHPSITLPACLSVESRLPTLPLALAAHAGDMPRLAQLLVGADVDEVDGGTGRTALSFAVEAGHVACVDMLTANNADVNIPQGNDGASCVFTAAKAGRSRVLRHLLLVEGVDVERADTDNATPLFAACCGGHHNCVSALLRTGEANVNSRDDYGWSPVLAACYACAKTLTLTDTKHTGTKRVKPYRCLVLLLASREVGARTLIHATMALRALRKDLIVRDGLDDDDNDDNNDDDDNDDDDSDDDDDDGNEESKGKGNGARGRGGNGARGGGSRGMGGVQT